METFTDILSSEGMKEKIACVGNDNLDAVESYALFGGAPLPGGGAPRVGRLSSCLFACLLACLCVALALTKYRIPWLRSIRSPPQDCQLPDHISDSANPCANPAATLSLLFHFSCHLNISDLPAGC